MTSKFIPTNKNSSSPKPEPRDTMTVRKEYGDALVGLGQARVAEQQAKNAQDQILQSLARLSDEYSRAEARDKANATTTSAEPAQEQTAG